MVVIILDGRLNGTKAVHFIASQPSASPKYSLVSLNRD